MASILKGTLTPVGQLKGMLSSAQVIKCTLGVPTSSAAKYRGEYTFTPTDETQVIATSGLLMIDNVTIDPIPSNYGRIAWDGVTLSVY